MFWSFLSLDFIRNSSLIEDAKGMCQLLDLLESVPVRFSFKKWQPVDFLGYMRQAEKLRAKLFAAQSVGLKQYLDRLSQRLIALSYRLESTNGGIDPAFAANSEQLFNRFLPLAKSWKKKQNIYFDCNLQEHEIEKLYELSSYVPFGELLLCNPELCDTVFTAVLRDCHRVEFIVQYPQLLEKLHRCGLQARIGRLGADMLKIEKQATPQFGDQVYEKVVLLPFEGRWESLLSGEKRITFRGNYTLSIDEIFNIFENKNLRVGNLELMAEGIINWNVHKLGWWDDEAKEYVAVPIYRDDWWKLVPFFEIIDLEEAKERYGEHLDGHLWSVAAMATRATQTLDYDQSHAFMEMAIPLKNGRYAIYDFGKFAIKFPSNMFEAVSMVCRTVEATVAYPDENTYYTHRQHARHAFSITEKQGRGILNAVRLDIIKARAGNFVYQIESENCAKWVHEKIEGVTGKLYNMFQIELLKSEPFGFLWVLFSSICILPASWQVRVFTFLHLPLGAAKTITIFDGQNYVIKSLHTHEFWDHGRVYLPAFLHKQITTGVFGLISAIKAVRIALSKALKGEHHDSNTDHFTSYRQGTPRGDSSYCASSPGLDSTSRQSVEANPEQALIRVCSGASFSFSVDFTFVGCYNDFIKRRSDRRVLCRKADSLLSWIGT